MFKKKVLFNVSLKNIPTEPKWYLLATAFNYEQKVAKAVKELANNHEEVKAVFLPFSYKRTVSAPKSGKSVTKITAIRGAYSGYVFVKMILNEKMWNLINNISGVAATMACGGQPQYVEDSDIDQIKSTLTFDGFTDEQRIDYIKELEDKWSNLNDNSFVYVKPERKLNPKSKPVRKRNSDRWENMKDVITDVFPFEGVDE